MPDHISPPMEVHETAYAEVSFEENILPILTSRYALAGCHVADGLHGLDFRTYESFIAGGEHGPAFIPGNAEESEVVEQIVLGNMPPVGPPLSPTEIQLFVTWINQQETRGNIIKHGHGDEHAEDMDGDMDDDHDDTEDPHDDLDAAHDGMDDDHDDDDDNGHDDNDDNGHDDDDDYDDDDNYGEFYNYSDTLHRRGWETSPTRGGKLSFAFY